MVLTYINSLNKNYKGEHTYEFLFSKSVEINFGEDWDVVPSTSGTVTPPPIEHIQGVAVLITKELDLILIQESDNFGMYDCVEKIIAMAWERESPDDEDRIVFHFGDTYDEVKKKLYSRDINIDIKNK